MQLLETSFIGLRSARHHLTSPSHAPSVTLFPMVHVGDAAFYERVYHDALEHDIVLLEGVRTKIANNLTRSYRWLNVQRLGLVVQPKIDSKTATGEIILADISGDEFENLWRKIPILKRAVVAVIVPAFGIFRRFFLTRAGLAKGQNQQDLPSRDDILMRDDMLDAFLSVLIDARDTHLCDCLSDVIEQNKSRDISIAIIYGAAHMPSVLQRLQEIGNYTPIESEWLTVIAT